MIKKNPTGIYRQRRHGREVEEEKDDEGYKPIVTPTGLSGVLDRLDEEANRGSVDEEPDMALRPRPTSFDNTTR